MKSMKLSELPNGKLDKIRKSLKSYRYKSPKDYSIYYRPTDKKIEYYFVIRNASMLKDRRVKELLLEYLV